MKYFSIFTCLLMMALGLSACGMRIAQASPTAQAVDLQGTIAAAAFTIVAETQAAIPTATPVPPTATFTDTPPPTLTLIPSQVSAVSSTPVPGGNSGAEDPCIHKTLPATLQGETFRMRIDNSTKATLSVSVYLNQNGPNSQCGYRSYTLAPGQFVVINDLVEGCYTLWAWNPDPDTYFIVTNGTDCLLASNTWNFDISTNSLKLQP